MQKYFEEQPTTRPEQVALLKEKLKAQFKKRFPHPRRHSSRMEERESPRPLCLCDDELCIYAAIPIYPGGR